MKEDIFLNWFRQLPEPFQTQAILNTEILFNSVTSTNVNNVLSKAFVFSRSPQGIEYWMLVEAGLFKSALDHLKSNNLHPIIWYPS